MKECTIIRNMMEYDIEGISQAFIHQGGRVERIS